MSPVLQVEHDVPLPPKTAALQTWDARLKNYRRVRSGRTRGTYYRRGVRWQTCEACHEGHALHVEYRGKHPASVKPLYVRDWMGKHELVFGRFSNRTTVPFDRFCAKCLRTWSQASPIINIDDLPLMPAHTGPEQRRTEPSGEQRLAAALIASAIYDLHRENDYHGGRTYRDDVKRWLLGARSLMSFQNCCDLLGLDPDWLRHAMLHMPHNPDQHYHPLEGQRLTGPHSVEEYVPDWGEDLRAHPGRNLPSASGGASNGTSSTGA